MDDITHLQILKSPNHTWGGVSRVDVGMDELTYTHICQEGKTEDDLTLKDDQESLL